MKYLKIKLQAFLFCATAIAYSQCDPVELVICDIATVDKPGGASPDGILNLTDAYNALPSTTVPIVTGTWFDPGFNYALNEANGDLYLWDLNDSSSSATTYVFELTRPECPDPVILNLIVGPFSGTVSANDPNVQICSKQYGMCNDPDPSLDRGFNLDQILDPLPSAHSNGVWKYVGTSPVTVNLVGSYFTACVPYDSGPPLTDEETFEFEYTVPGIPPCSVEVSTRVTVSVVRDVVSGAGSFIHICEQQLQDGDYDSINLRDDVFLEGEDDEGTWSDYDGTGQISNPGDQNINLGEVYDDLYATNQRFGCKVYTYIYSVNDRSNVCEDMSTSVDFKFYEKIRPFQQTVPPPEFCAGDPNLVTFDLYSLLDFTVENGVLYDYPNRECTNWTLKSTTAPRKTNLGLSSNTGDLCIIDTIDDSSYNTEGRINLSNLTNDQVGTYVFQYTVLADYNCRDEIPYEYPDPLPPCEDFTGEVTIKIKKYNHAGEDTSLDLCEDNTKITTSLDLFTLLATNNSDTIYKEPDGVWKDNVNNVVVTNPITLTAVSGKQSFDFTYKTPKTIWGCEDEANLKFTIYEKYEPGVLNVPSLYNICDTDAPFNVFDLLTGADNNGVWTLPDGSKTTTNNYTFDPQITTPGLYVYTVPENELGNVVCPSSSVSVTINVIKNFDPGLPYPNPQVFCIYDDLSINLFEYIDGNPSKTGVFVNDPKNPVDVSPAINGNDLFTKLIPEAGFYRIKYLLQAPSCDTISTLIKLDVKGLANAGISAKKDVCSDDVSFNLFDELGGTPDDTGRWLDALDQEMSPNNTYNFDPSSVDAGAYIFKYEVSGIVPCDKKVTSSVTVNVIDRPSSGNDVSKLICRSSGVVNLEDYLSDSADLGGIFIDQNNTGALEGSNLDLSLLESQDYTFTYEVSNGPCNSLPIEMKITPVVLQNPAIAPQTFCVTDGKTLNDIDVTTNFNNIWYESLTATVSLPGNTVLVPDTDYYVASADDGSCESNRVKFRPNLLPITDKACNPCIPEGVSPNGDGINDILDLCGLPYVFPKYSFKIFNRYGTVVFNGGYNNPEFKGRSNVSMTFGKELPTGVYFYIFDPKDGETKPFQGNFYLSR